MKYYIRFGELPENGKSIIWSNGEIKKGYEKGVSVFDTAKINGKWKVILPLRKNKKAMVDIKMFILYSGITAYLVSGRKEGSTGTDGEPLLKNCKIRKKLEKLNADDVLEYVKLRK